MAFHIRFTTPTYLFQTYPQDWIAKYSQEGLVMQDPTVLWGFENTGSISWADLTAQDAHGVMEKARGYGLEHGLTIAIEEGDSRSICSFARSDRAFTAAEVGELEAATQELHAATLTLDTNSPELRDALKKMSIDFTHPEA